MEPNSHGDKHEARLTVVFSINYIIVMAQIPTGRRMYNRYEANSSAWVRRVLEKPITVLMENISARGAAILGYQPFNVNETLTILFNLAFMSDRKIHKQARVAGASK